MAADVGGGAASCERFGRVAYSAPHMTTSKETQVGEAHAEPRVRTAVVTGASAGIGAEIARALGALGWRVAIGARRLDRLDEVACRVESAGGRALAHELDVTDAASIDAFFDAVEDRFGFADVIVNNAGLSRPGALHELDVEDIRAEVDTNLLGPMLVCRRALPAMIESGEGDLVFIGSLNAVMERHLQSGYTATKTGIEGLARALRLDLCATRIRTTVLRPGPTLSEFGASWDPQLLGRLLEAWRDGGLLPHDQFLPAERIADAVVHVVTAPPDTQWDLVQINPTPPVR